VLDHWDKEDGSITFVLVSGPKLNMTEKELRTAIEKMEGEQKAAFGEIIHTNEEAQETVRTLTPTHRPKPKKGE